MKPIPAPTKATGPVAAVFADEPWLYSYDLPDDRDTRVKVEAVPVWRRLDLAGTVHQNVHGLKFVGKKKILLLTSKAVFKAMVQVAGKTFEDWVGKEITLYVDHNVEAFGRTVDAIRIRTPVRGKNGSAQAADRWLDDDPGPAAGDPGPGATATASAPATATATADKSDEQLFHEFSDLAEKACASFGGERLFIKQAPPKSGQWFTCDPALGDTHALYQAATKKLLCAREQLAELTAKLQAIAS